MPPKKKKHKTEAPTNTLFGTSFWGKQCYVVLRWKNGVVETCIPAESESAAIQIAKQYRNQRLYPVESVKVVVTEPVLTA